MLAKEVNSTQFVVTEWPRFGAEYRVNLVFVPREQFLEAYKAVTGAVNPWEHFKEGAFHI